MKYTFSAPDKSDKRMEYAVEALKNMGYRESETPDLIVFGVNPKINKEYNVPCFAGNVSGKGIIDYTKDEAFAIQNAYLTAEAALAVACEHSDLSLVNSNVLITGYGRIAKALHKYCEPLTKNITICARSAIAQALARMQGAVAIDFTALTECGKYDFIFNTVPHPVFNEFELKSVKKGAVIIDLASFPGGVDRHFAEHFGLNLVVARGLPAKYSPKSAGIIVAETIDRMVKEVIA